jgi:hypothetical protein
MELFEHLSLSRSVTTQNWQTFMKTHFLIMTDNTTYQNIDLSTRITLNALETSFQVYNCKYPA